MVSYAMRSIGAGKDLERHFHVSEQLIRMSKIQAKATRSTTFPDLGWGLAILTAANYLFAAACKPCVCCIKSSIQP